MVEPLIRVRGLQRYFDVSAPLLNRIIERRPRVYLRAVDGVDFEIPKGRTFALVGESGCGKSTVARLLVGLYTPTAGEIRFDGMLATALHSRQARAPLHRRMQMIFQDPYASLNPRWRVRRIVAEPLHAMGIIADPSARVQRVAELLEQVGLDAADGDKFPHEFSGGQRQRISIARALASTPDFLICDEPTSALDVSVQAQVLNLLKDLQQSLGLTYLLITHDLAVVHHMANRVGVMYLGRLCEVADAATLFGQPRHPYTRLLMETLPRLDFSGADREPMAGEVASPIDPPTGCAFHPRCPYAAPRCRSERPELVAVDNDLVACHAVQESRLPSWSADP